MHPYITAALAEEHRKDLLRQAALRAPAHQRSHRRRATALPRRSTLTRLWGWLPRRRQAWEACGR
jgi:hypothetical protein